MDHESEAMLRERAERAEKRVSQLVQHLSEEKQRCAQQKQQIEQLEAHVAMLQKRLQLQAEKATPERFSETPRKTGTLTKEVITSKSPKEDPPKDLKPDTKLTSSLVRAVAGLFSDSPPSHRHSNPGVIPSISASGSGSQIDSARSKISSKSERSKSSSLRGADTKVVIKKKGSSVAIDTKEKEHRPADIVDLKGKSRPRSVAAPLAQSKIKEHTEKEKDEEKETKKTRSGSSPAPLRTSTPFIPSTPTLSVESSPTTSPVSSSTLKPSALTSPKRTPIASSPTAITSPSNASAPTPAAPGTLSPRKVPRVHGVSSTYRKEKPNLTAFLPETDRKSVSMIASMGPSFFISPTSSRRVNRTSTPISGRFKSGQIRRSKSEELLSSWECVEQTICRRPSSKVILVPPEQRVRSSSVVATALEQEYRDSGTMLVHPKKDQPEIVYTASGSIRAASMMRLVDFVVFQNSDTELVRTLLITYRLFEKSGWLMSNLTFTFSRAANDVLRRRVVFILRRWLECSPCDFEDSTMRANLTRFIERDVRKKAGMGEHAASLLHALAPIPTSSSIVKTTSSSYDSSSCSSGSDCCTPTCNTSSLRGGKKKNMPVEMYTYLNIPIAKLEVLAIDPCILADQLTLVDFASFRSISTSHWLANCTEKNWLNTPVQALVERFNNVSMHLAFEVVTTFHLKKRTALLRHLILTARRCYEQNNFHGLMAILSSLSMSAVARLKKTWRGLPNNVRAMHTQLEDITDPKANFQAYRQSFKRITPPGIPYLAVCMRDLTVMHEANPCQIGRGLANVEKCEMLAKIVSDFQVCKSMPYSIQPIPALHRYIESLSHDDSVITEGAIRSFSLRCEPRAVEL